MPFHGLSRWIREGPAAPFVPWRTREALERWTVRHGYPASRETRVEVAPGAPAARLLFGGDIALHRWDPSQPLAPVFDPLARLLRSADLAVANLESVLTARTEPASSLGTSLRADPAAAAVLTHLGLAGVTCANNHSLDYGGAGLAESLGHVEAAGVRTAGVAREGSDGSLVLPAGGLRVGLLAYTDDWRPPPPDDPGPRPNPHDPETVAADVARLRARADLVVVQLHWGYEWTVYPERSLRDAARAVIDAGADVVVCHHAHVPMALERWGRGVIAHGLGNLYFGRSQRERHPLYHVSYVLAVDVAGDGVRAAHAIPVRTRRNHSVGPSEGRPAEAMHRCLACLGRRLGDDRYLERVERALVTEHAASLVQDIASRVAGEDRTGYAERIRHLEPPRQRRLTARLRGSKGVGGAWAGVLEALRASGESPPTGGLAQELAREGAAAARWLGRPRSLGRIP